VFATAIVVVALAAVLASALPVGRMLQRDPLLALRHD
jgi:ABC-type antimicrobial peptide transport system permease subunit